MAETLYIGKDSNTSKMLVVFKEADVLDAIETMMGLETRAYIESLLSIKVHGSQNLFGGWYS